MDVDLLNKVVHSRRHSAELGRFRTDHFDKLGHVSSRKATKFVQRFQATKYFFLGRFSVEKLQYGHGQLGVDIIKDLFIKRKKLLKMHYI